MTARLAMQGKKVLLFILFQEIMNVADLNTVEKPSVTSTSRSAFFVSRKNTRLVGHAIKWFYSPSLLSCGQLCLSKTWCTSINFKMSSKEDGKGTCELNKHNWPLIDEYGILQSQHGVTFALLIKGCLKAGCLDGGSCLFDKKNETFSCVKEPQTDDNSDIQTDCDSSKPLGMEDGSIPDNKITASSTHSNSEVAWGRLHYSQGSWTPNTDTGYQWLQVNFVPEVKLITHIATQGNGKSWWWVKEYYVMYKKGGGDFKEYMENNHRVLFPGNKNKDGEVKNKITNPFQGDTVRIKPTAFSGRIALRIELYGCEV
ncbi:EGF-like repeat and discoidin I-like domain-containing protein 3 isoform X1 [Orbicella faveolata]|uniref:EGF-like repeat and discoidin I-like domain-containing protein 3 isoform X1 n=1 Tax=Orbicella faveolata TaxID=48498 RepID=UPI0009E2600E|nr:EGF-like repeat and discoidin I-like domain-containing protein 3 isoform X1 [Orbicella faveolata]